MEIADVFGSLPVLETDRLRLRRIAPGDLDDIFEYTSDPEVARFTTWSAHHSIEDSRSFLNTVLEQYASGKVAPWGVEYKPDKKLIGTYGFGQWWMPHARAEIGYALSRTYWNRGLATEAAHTVIDFGFRRMQLNRIQARCIVENIASARVMQKAGMHFEGILRQDFFSAKEGVYLDLAMYSILRSEWAG